MQADISTFLSLCQVTDTNETAVSCFNAKSVCIGTSQKQQLARLLSNARAGDGSDVTLNDILADYDVYKRNQWQKNEGRKSGGPGWWGKAKKYAPWAGLGALAGALGWGGTKLYKRWRGRDPKGGLVPGILSDVKQFQDRTMRELWGENYKKNAKDAPPVGSAEKNTDLDKTTELLEAIERGQNDAG